MGYPLKHLGYPLIHGDHGTVTLKTKDPLTVLVCPDLHFPFHHPDAFRFLKDMRDEFKPDIFVNLGDECDFAALSFHDKNPQMPGANDELEQAKECMKKLFKIFPDALVCSSNHTSRSFRAAYKAGIPSQMIKAYKELFEAPPGWSWHDRIIINDVCFIHGDPKSGFNAARQWMIEQRMSTCIGHVHGHAGVGYSASPFNQTFWMNAGCLIDLHALAFRYGNSYAHKGTLGCGIVRGGKEAFFVPMR